MHKTITMMLLPIALSACTLVDVSNPEETQNTETGETLNTIIEQQPVRETSNVTYTGTVEPAGISIYQQGSHRLTLPGGKFVLLESEDVDLNGYIGEQVTIFGSLRPTVEAGGMIMRVDRIELVAQEEEKSSSSDAMIEESSSSSSADTIIEEESSSSAASIDTGEEISSASVSTTSTVSSASSAQSAMSETQSSTSSAASQASVEYSAEFQERIEVMARQDYAPENWSQQYCSSHIGFCSPVHRNWWFKSFGTTNDILWHVELSSEPIESLNQGPISIDLIAGEIPNADESVEISNGMAMGYKEWTFGRHFVISGDASLEDAISYITQNITEYTE